MKISKNNKERENYITITTLLTQAYNTQRPAGRQTHHLDIQLILSVVLGESRLFVLTNPAFEVPPAAAALFMEKIEEYAAGCPLAYLTGNTEFYGRNFIVNESVLIPRADTETVVQAALEALGGLAGKSPTVLEIGTGTGCITCTLALENPNTRVTATDISPAALDIARQNAARLGADVVFLQSDIFSQIPPELAFDVIISNPPYIKTAEIDTLDRSVRAFEPHLALDGGADGLFFYKAIADGARQRLLPQGRLVFEIGYDQAEAVISLLTKRGFTDIKVLKDLAQKDRCIICSIN